MNFDIRRLTREYIFAAIFIGILYIITYYACDIKDTFFLLKSWLLNTAMGVTFDNVIRSFRLLYIKIRNMR